MLSNRLAPVLGFRSKCDKLRALAPLLAFLILAPTILAPEAYANRDGSGGAERAQTDKKCSGANCLYQHQINALKAAAGRKYPSVEQMCDMGDASITELEIYNKAAAYCANSYTVQGERQNNIEEFINEAKLQQHADLDPRVDSSLRKFVTNPAMVPNALMLFYANSNRIYAPHDHCGYFGREGCFEDLRIGMATTGLGSVLLSNLAWEYEQLEEPREDNCVKQIMENQAAQYIQWLEATPETAKDFCKTAKYLMSRRTEVSKFNSESLPMLKDTLARITKAYDAWQTDSTTGISQGYFKKVFEQTNFTEVSDTQMYGGATCYALKNKNTISISPYFESFLNIPGGKNNLFLIIAHEFGHLASLNQYGRVFPEVWLGSLSDQLKFGNCADYFFGSNARGLLNDINTQDETTADLFASAAAAYALPDTATPRDWQHFMYNATIPWCSLFYLGATKTPSEAFISQNHFGGGHAPTWTRLNAMFSNNRLREKLGCKKIEGPYAACHEMKLKLAN
jgi:hypothetical protein